VSSGQGYFMLRCSDVLVEELVEVGASLLSKELVLGGIRERCSNPVIVLVLNPSLQLLFVLLDDQFRDDHLWDFSNVFLLT
jgi:hypothetical protein